MCKQYFIYVFDIKDANKLIADGFTPLKFDRERSTYIFANRLDDNTQCFSFEDKLNYEYCDMKYVLSNTISF